MASLAAAARRASSSTCLAPIKQAPALLGAASAPDHVIQVLAPLLTTTPALLAASSATKGLFKGHLAAPSLGLLAADVRQPAVVATPALLAASVPDHDIYIKVVQVVAPLLTASAPTPALLAASAPTEGLIKGYVAAPSLGLLASSVATKGHLAATSLGLLAAPSLGLLAADVRQPATAAKLGRGLLNAKTIRASGGGLFSTRSAGRYISTGGHRGMATEVSVTPELRSELQRMNEASVARHMEAVEKLSTLKTSTRKAYAMHNIAKADRVIDDAKVGWRIVWGSLACATIGLYCLLHTKSLWFVHFKVRILCLLTDKVANLKEELETKMKEIVREELGGTGAAMPGTVSIGDILSDPELVAAFGDTEVVAALRDVMSNPSNLAKHQANPKVGPIITKVMAKFNGRSNQ